MPPDSGLPPFHPGVGQRKRVKSCAAAQKVGPDRARIRDYLASLTATTAYQGVSGPIYFRPDGDPMERHVVMTRIDRGTLRVAVGAP